MILLEEPFIKFLYQNLVKSIPSACEVNFTLRDQYFIVSVDIKIKKETKLRINEDTAIVAPYCPLCFESAIKILGDLDLDKFNKALEVVISCMIEKVNNELENKEIYICPKEY